MKPNQFNFEVNVDLVLCYSVTKVIMLGHKDRLDFKKQY